MEQLQPHLSVIPLRRELASPPPTATAAVTVYKGTACSPRRSDDNADDDGGVGEEKGGHVYVCWDMFAVRGMSHKRAAAPAFKLSSVTVQECK
jgi:hypothetical protein